MLVGYHEWVRGSSQLRQRESARGPAWPHIAIRVEIERVRAGTDAVVDPDHESPALPIGDDLRAELVVSRGGDGIAVRLPGCRSRDRRNQDCGKCDESCHVRRGE